MSRSYTVALQTTPNTKINDKQTNAYQQTYEQKQNAHTDEQNPQAYPNQPNKNNTKDKPNRQ